MALLSKGLLGYGGLGGLSGPTLPPGLLAQYDPKQMKQQQLKRGLLQAGIAMLQNGRGSTGEVLGNAFAGGLQGAQQAGDDYFQQSMQYQQLADQQAKIAQQQQQEQKVQAWIDSLPPEQQAMAEAFPDKAAEAFLKAQAGGGGDEYGLVPQWGYNPSTGKYGLFQPNKSGGSPAQMQFPEGYEPQPPTSFQDLGTSVGAFSGRGGQQLGTTPIDISGKQTQEEVGTNIGKKIAAAPNDIAAADNALAIIDSLRKDPNKSRGVGASSIFNVVPGTAGRSYQRKVDQATAGAFMTGIQAMRGMGALSDAEGKRASDAVARMDTSTTEEEFDAALNDYEGIVRQAKAKAEKFLQQPPTNNAPSIAVPEGIAPDIWGAMTPEEKALWQN